MADPPKSLRVGIIGTGNMGRRHGRAYGYHEPRTKLVACCDLRREAAVEYGRQYGCDVEPSVEALLARTDVDAVSICTTEEHHLEPTLLAARAGKHILLEKPMAVSLDDAVRMKEAAEGAGVKLMVGHLFRYDQRSVAVRDAIGRGEIGEVRSLACTFHGIPSQQDRIRDLELSIVVFRGCHAIDLMRWLSGSEVIRIYAESLDGQLRSRGYHSEDAVFCVMRFENGAAGGMEINSHVPESHPTAGKAEMTVIGTEGMISIDYGRPWYTQADGRGFSVASGNQ